MNTQNLKCPVCGYVFEADTEVEQGVCPLCCEKYNTEKALSFYKENENTTTVSNKKSNKKIFLEYVIFFVSFSLFIVFLYFIFSYILGT